MAKKIIMHRKTATGYDEITPDTHISQINCSQEVMFDVGADFPMGDDIMNHISSTDKMISGYGTTSGTSKAYTLSLEGKPDMAIVDGMMIRAKFHVANDEEPTINVNGSGAKNIYGLNQLKLLFTIAANAWVILMYSDSIDGWIVQGWAKKKVFKTEVIKESTNWIVPDITENGIEVMLFGGGAGGGTGIFSGTAMGAVLGMGGAGGGGGHMAKSVLTVTPGKIIKITIGTGGASDRSGGITSFDTLLSANGGQSRNGGSGGGGESSSNYSVSDSYHGKGGDASYGGGGGGGSYFASSSSFDLKGAYGGNGGTYGGGGGGGYASASNSSILGSSDTYLFKGGAGKNSAHSGSSGSFSETSVGVVGISGGGGGGYSQAAYNFNGGTGENTIGKGLDFEGAGQGGKRIASYHSSGSGGGGYGGNGGNGGIYGGGGGGGYGGNGGNGGSNGYGGGGGGGGYGGNGGNGASDYGGGGGGGGYGLNGNGGHGSEDGIGGDGGTAAGGGGGGVDTSSGSTTRCRGGNGGSGLCILSYWSWDVDV